MSADADLVYRALMLAGTASCSRLARDLGLPTRRTGAALDELAAVAAIRQVPAGKRTSGREHHWQAQSPARVLTSLRQRRASAPGDWERVRRHLSVVAGLSLPERDTAGLRVRPLPSRQLARRRIAELTEAERSEHLAINTEQVISSDAAAAALPTDRARLARGVRTRVLGLPPADGDKGCSASEELAELPNEYRERSTLPVKLLVFDRRVALVAADPLDFERGVLEIAEPDAVDALVHLFYRHWSQAHDPRQAGVPNIVLTSRERALVALLAAGHTDQLAARELNLSRRTIVATVSALMDRLGLENRFQLGLVLGASANCPIPTGHQ